ncbi:MAG: methyl-accepting chemotaxis protein, partial [Ktedonobacterales bacterium]|nr:methyl-accepting chemotaxis protein [Ktedonobacterales bacterium]
MSPDSGRSRAAFASQFNGMVGIVTLVPVLAMLGVVVAIWYIDKLSFPLALSYEILFIADIAGAVLVGLITLLVWNRVRDGVRSQALQLAAVAQAVAEGAPGVRANVVGNDEFAQLALSFNAMLEQRDAVGGSLGLDAVALQGQIEKLLQEVSAVGEGDLRVQAEVTPDTLGVLADSFNYMIEELAKVVGRVQSTSQQVIMATRRILERASELTRASEAQYSQTTQTLEQVEELAAFILSAARNATLSASAAQDALRSSQEGQQAVNQTIDGMQLIRDNVQDTAKKIKRLGERSQEISDIVRIIEELAEQTNLLALNAAIQSAMAGENGRGFAVVADEIRLLAERSGEAAKRIVMLVKGIQTETQEVVQAMEDSTVEVVKGSNMADNAGRALQAIYFAVENQARMVEDIATAASERSTTSELVAAAMNRIAELTRQTNTMMQDTATNVSFLADLADQLRASVSTFRLPANLPQQIAPPQMGRPMGGPPDPRMGGYYPPQGPMGGGPMAGLPMPA